MLLTVSFNSIDDHNAIEVLSAYGIMMLWTVSFLSIWDHDAMDGKFQQHK